MAELKKQSVVTLEIEDLAYGGAGVAKPDGFVVFVQGAIPGDRVRARIIKKSKNHASAVIEEIESASDRRLEAPCHLFGECGGCTWQMLSYEDQLRWKQKQVADTLTHLGGMASLPEIEPIIASPEIWNYRNKMEFSFGTVAQEGTILGFHRPGRFDQVLKVDRCLIHPEPFDSLLETLMDFASRHGLSAYHQRTHEGFLRHAVMRHSRSTGGVVLILITAPGELPHIEDLSRSLKENCPALQGFIWATNGSVADVATIEREEYRWGDPVLSETINGLSCTISPQSFFQTNPSAAERLYKTVASMAELAEDDTVLDAYCGSGLIALHCASKVRRVAGIEITAEAVWDARRNARANGIDNALFISAPIREGLPLARNAIGGHFSKVIIDPPRGGMHKKALSHLIDLEAPVFLYVSCNPSTLARDLVTICEAGYVVDAVQPIDLFPQTYHIEVVVRLKREVS